MGERRGKFLPEKSASLVGFALLMVVVFTQATKLLMGYVGTPQNPKDATVMLPGWMLGSLGLLSVVLSFGLPFLFLLQSGKSLGFELRKGKSRVPVWVLLPLFMGLVVVANSVSTLMRTFFIGVLGLPPIPVAGFPETSVETVFYFLTVCVAAPVLEELFFRGAMQQLLRFWGARFAILLTSIVFVMMHSSLWDLPTVLVLSLLLGYTYEISRSVRACILLHFANNTMAFLMQLFQRRMAINAGFAMVLWLMVLLVALFAGAIWAVRFFKLGRKFVLRRDARELGSIKKRLIRIVKVPTFTVGMLVILVYFVIGLTN